jgi:hypothetical protein
MDFMTQNDSEFPLVPLFFYRYGVTQKFGQTRNLRWSTGSSYIDSTAWMSSYPEFASGDGVFFQWKIHRVGIFFTMQVIIPSSVHIEYHPPKNMVSYWVYSFRVYRGISYGDWSLGKLIPQPYFSGLWNHGTPNCHLVCIPPFQTKPRSQVCVKYIIYVVVEFYLWYLCCCLVIYIICPMIFLQNSCFLRERSLIITH